MMRWAAAITYRLDGDQIEGRLVRFEELDELHDIIECGPSFCAIVNIVVTYLGEKETLLEASQS